MTSPRACQLISADCPSRSTRSLVLATSDTRSPANGGRSRASKVDRGPALAPRIGGEDRPCPGKAKMMRIEIERDAVLGDSTLPTSHKRDGRIEDCHTLRLPPRIVA